MEKNKVAIVGGGLAGCEAAWQLARQGVSVTVFEMKPENFSPAHESESLAELVCSNSFRSDEPTTGVGVLKREMRQLGSLFMHAAEKTRVPAGKALAVDRERFSAFISGALEEEKRIRVLRKEISGPDDPGLAGFDRVIVAAGPLASADMSKSLMRAVGEEALYFYDAIAPIVSTDSVDMQKAFWASRYAPEEKDYLNCPFTEQEYFRFLRELLQAEQVAPREFEKEIHFEGCLPIETMASRGDMTLAFGPLKPVGLADPRTGGEPFAVLQLRSENAEKSALNLVGFQTKLTYPEQKRVFRMIPGLEKAEFLRLGSIHRNTYVNAPRVLNSSLELKNRPEVYLAGQITGVEGYVESAACGLWLGLKLGRELNGEPLPDIPPETALGALMGHLRTEVKKFQPSNVHFGLFPPLNVRAKKARRKELHAERADEAMQKWLGAANL